MIPVYQIKIPEYTVKEKPDWVNIGIKIDKKIKKHFPNKKIAIRCLSSKDHKGKSISQVINIIKKIGHDRYNPKRKGDRYENIQNKHIDFFALGFTVKPKTIMLENFIESFYVWPLKFNKKPTRLEIVIIYDLSKLKRIPHQYEGRNDIKKDGFVFKNPKNKKEALLGIMKIL
ncbi:hypothetical protein CL617_02945 [archaeon]|nr:hypothetical protein [archaeon]|tara:strand:+ start:6523 stop:7041 length:519 start_codon:yes stop_codon:yes gene_type:complete